MHLTQDNTFARQFSLFLLYLVLFCARAAGLSNSTGPNGTNVRALHALGFSGQNVNIGLISQCHARYTHEAFGGAVSWYDATGQSVYEPLWHDTSMAGILASRGGQLYPDEKGAAPRAEVLSVRVTQPADTGGRLIRFRWFADALTHIHNAGCGVVVTGIQLSEFTADGGSGYSLLYDYYAYQHNIIFAVGAGNNTSSISVFGDTFNGITAAGLILENSDAYNQVGTWSNPGPTLDLRRKPEIGGPSQGQRVPTASGDKAWRLEGVYPRGETSWAVAHVAGTAAALLSYARTHGPLYADRSEVIKAVMVNAAFPNIFAQDGGWTDPAHNAWHSDRGYGRLDALRAYEILAAPKVYPGDTIPEPRGWAYAYLLPGHTHTYRLNADIHSRLAATLTWHRRVVWTDKRRGSPLQYNGLIDEDELQSFLADLDLELYDASAPAKPLANRLSAVDNLEKIDVRLEKSGVYLLRVRNRSTSEPAHYALAFELIEPLAGDLNHDYRVNEADLLEFSGRWLTAGYDLPRFGAMAAEWLVTDGRYAVP